MLNKNESSVKEENQTIPKDGTIEVTLLKNIKYGRSVHKMGEIILIKKDDLPEFLRADACKIGKFEMKQEIENGITTIEFKEVK